jgi:hypothetical protein
VTSQFQNDCPYCRTKSAGFVVHHQWGDRTRQNFASLLAVCAICNNGIVVRLRNVAGYVVADYARNNHEFPLGDDRILEIHPKTSGEVPSDCPASVERFYLQGLMNLASENWDAAGAMFRKTLDVATKIIAPGRRGENLYSRINALADERLITPAMGEWSHELRIDGNDAVHDEEPENAEDAHAMQKFAEAFLRYAFTLPNLVAQNRAKRDSAD